MYKLFKRFARIIFICIFTLVLIEVLMRLFVPAMGLNLRGLVRIPTADTGFSYEFVPHASLTAHGVNYKINGQQMRDIQDHPQQANKGTLRIAVIGDSVGFGYGIPFEETLGQQLEKKVSEELSQPVEVLNFSVPGYGVRNELLTLKERVAQFKPDVVIYLLCQNDISDDETIDSQGQVVAFDSSPFEKSLYQYSRIYSYIKTINYYKQTKQAQKQSIDSPTGVEVRSDLISFQNHLINTFNPSLEESKPYYPRLEEAVKTFSQQAAQQGFTAIILTAPTELQLRQQVTPTPQTSTCELSQKYDNVTCIDVLPSFIDAYNQKSAPLFVDFVHLSGTGTQLVVESLHHSLLANKEK